MNRTSLAFTLSIACALLFNACKGDVSLGGANSKPDATCSTITASQYDSPSDLACTTDSDCTGVVLGGDVCDPCSDSYYFVCPVAVMNTTAAASYYAALTAVLPKPPGISFSVDACGGQAVSCPEYVGAACANNTCVAKTSIFVPLDGGEPGDASDGGQPIDSGEPDDGGDAATIVGCSLAGGGIGYGINGDCPLNSFCEVAIGPCDDGGGENMTGGICSDAGSMLYSAAAICVTGAPAIPSQLGGGPVPSSCTFLYAGIDASIPRGESSLLNTGPCDDGGGTLVTLGGCTDAGVAYESSFSTCVPLDGG